MKSSIHKPNCVGKTRITRENLSKLMYVTATYKSLNVISTQRPELECLDFLLMRVVVEYKNQFLLSSYNPTEAAVPL